MREKRIFIEEKCNSEFSLLLVKAERLRRKRNRNNYIPRYAIATDSDIGTQSIYTPEYKISYENEKRIDKLEKDIPKMASKVFKKAYRESLEHGNGVTRVIDNIIYKVYADGRKEKIKEIEPLLKIDMNIKIILG